MVGPLQRPLELAVFNQGLWLISHFRDPFVTIMGRNLFGDHTSFILLLVAPFYRLFPEPQGLLVLQTLLLAGAAVPIYLLAQRYIKSTVIATLLVAMYLLNPALQQGNLDQFHPEAFQVLIISLAIYAAIRSKPILLAVMVVLALMVKEDAAALIVPLGLWVMFRRDRKWGPWIVAGAVAWALLANEVIIRSILGSNSFYSGRIPFGGLTGLLSTIVKRPGQVVDYFKSGGRPFYLWQLGVSAGWGFLLAPEIAAIALLVAFEDVVSNDIYMHQILYQYSMPVVPVLALGTLFAIAAQKNLRRRNVATGVAVVLALWSCILWGLAPFSSNRPTTYWTPDAGTLRALAHLESMMPANAVVSAYWPLVSHIDQRSQIYVWPNPFSAANWGLGTNSGARLPVASQVQYLLVPDTFPAANDVQEFAKVKPYFRVVRSDGGYDLYERNSR